MRVIGCFCFLNINNPTVHKLSPRSSPCLFIGYPLLHRGYHCLDLKTNKVVISRHVIFDDFFFPATSKNTTPNSYEFLSKVDEPSTMFRDILQTSSLPTSVPTAPVPNLQHPETHPLTSVTQHVPMPPPVRHHMTQEVKLVHEKSNITHPFLHLLSHPFPLHIKKP